MFWRELECPKTAGARTLPMKGFCFGCPVPSSAISAGVLDRFDGAGAAVRVSCVAPSLTYRKADLPDSAMMK
jgi:hypothetical protein